MYKQKELDAIREALPPNGYQLVAEKLNRVSKETVRKVLNEPARYNRVVIDAAILVIKEEKELIELQKNEVKSILK